MTRAFTVSTLPIGLGAGLASAALFAALVGGSVLALPLFFLTPVPLALAALGWGTTTGLVAGAIAVAGAGFGLGTSATVAIALAFVVPTLVAAHLAGLARIVDPGDPASAVEWYPLGRVLVAIAATVALGTIVGGIVSGYDPEATTAQILDLYREAMVDGGAGTPSAHDIGRIEPFVRGVVRLMPAVFPAFGVGTLVFDLWAAARIVRKSGRLVRPAEDLTAVELPVAAGLVFAAALALAFVDGPIGLVAEVVAGALFIAHTVIGFAVLHALARRSEAKIIILAFVYGLIFLFTIPIALVALVGLVEPHLGLRRRFAAPGRS